jgi:hypothetical protein
MVGLDPTIQLSLGLRVKLGSGAPTPLRPEDRVKPEDDKQEEPEDKEERRI